jgi:hypothetical protein
MKNKLSNFIFVFNTNKNSINYEHTFIKAETFDDKNLAKYFKYIHLKEQKQKLKKLDKIKKNVSLFGKIEEEILPYLI